MAVRITNQLVSEAPSVESHESDCEKVVGIFEKWLKGKATDEDEEYLAAQTDECSPCFDSIDHQQLFVQFLNNALNRPGTPASLVENIKSKIHQTA